MAARLSIYTRGNDLWCIMNILINYSLYGKIRRELQSELASGCMIQLA